MPLTRLESNRPFSGEPTLDRAGARISRPLHEVVGEFHDSARLRTDERRDRVGVPIYLGQRHLPQEIGNEGGRERVARADRINDLRWNSRTCRLLVPGYQQRAPHAARERRQTKIITLNELSQHVSWCRGIELTKLRNFWKLLLVQLHRRCDLQRCVDGAPIEELLAEIHVEHA